VDFPAPQAVPPVILMKRRCFLQTVTKAGKLIKGENADRGFFNESIFYFLCSAPNIQQNLKYHQQIYQHIQGVPPTHECSAIGTE
jgi:hypothetical protein